MIPANLLLLERACQEVGVKEISGSEHAPEILKYLELAGFDHLFDDDETPWCSTFMNAMCAVLCLERSGKPNARSWLEVGERTHDPKPGDVVVFWRGSQNSWKDEWLTILFSIPLILCFLPFDWADRAVQNGFAALESMPDWYQYTLGIIVAASFGVRSATKFFGGKK